MCLDIPLIDFEDTQAPVEELRRKAVVQVCHPLAVLALVLGEHLNNLRARLFAQLMQQLLQRQFR